MFDKELFSKYLWEQREAYRVAGMSVAITDGQEIL